jgi:hypothetical protein
MLKLTALLNNRVYYFYLYCNFYCLFGGVTSEAKAAEEAM